VIDLLVKKENVLNDAPPDSTGLIDQRQMHYISRLRAAICHAPDLDAAKDIRSRVKAFRAYAASAGESLELLNDLAEMKLQSERSAGRMLLSMKKKSNRFSTEDSLSELGVSHKQSERWQKLASIPDGEVERYFAEQRESGKEITQRGLMRVKFRQEESPRLHRGFKCPYCSNRTQRVQHTDRVVSVQKKRHLKCLGCERKFVTTEFVYDPENPPQVYPVHFVTPVGSDAGAE